MKLSKKVRKTFLPLVATLGLIACGAPASDEETEAEVTPADEVADTETETTEETTEETTDTETEETADTSDADGEEVELEELSAAGAVKFAYTALASELKLPKDELAEEASALALNGIDLPHALNLADTDGDGFDDNLIVSDAEDADSKASLGWPKCNPNGSPLATPTKLLSENDPTYAKAKTDCYINMGASSDTVAGNIAMVSSIMCAFEQSLGAPLEFSETEKTYPATEIKIAEPCWTKDHVANMVPEMGTDTISVGAITSVKPEDPFPNKLTLTLPGDMGGFKLELLITEDQFSFARNETDDRGQSLFIVSIDRSAGILRFANKGPRWGNVSTGLIYGEFAEDGSIQQIDGQDILDIRWGYPTSGGEDNTVSSRDDYVAAMVVSKGDNANGIGYSMQNYTCRGQGENPQDCKDLTVGTFSEASTYCSVRGGDSCLTPLHTFSLEDVPFMAVDKAFYDEVTNYQNPKKTELDDFLANPRPLCFSSAMPYVNPNQDCERFEEAASLTEGLNLATRKVTKKVSFRRSKKNKGNHRISDWTSKCGEKEGEIHYVYQIGGKKKIGNSLIRSLNAGVKHSVDFGIISNYGKFYSDYEMDVKITKNGELLAEKKLTDPGEGAKNPDQSMPITLNGFTADDVLEVKFDGKFKCAKSADIGGKNSIAYSMSWTPGALRVVYETP